ncbi:MAG: lipopolysaccharide biosynthesis protein RfbH [Magnetococcales bacterium]|nr:lipopolysaccharide biosynthesis protein RfbH [Magnetococcales bacterium]
MDKRQIREKILSLVDDYAQLAFKDKKFEPNLSPVPPSGKVIGAPELQNLVEASLDGWLTTGRFNEKFEQRLGSYLGAKHLLTTNSGSSANLLALTALTSPLLGERALKPGDEVLTVAASFPTTVNPIINNGLIPLFVDIEIPSYNIDVSRIKDAISPKTKAIMIAHTLGNPFDLEQIIQIASQHNMWVVEDCCDALGSRYNGQLVGTFGDISTLSFFPAHHITMGEGGAVFTNSGILRRIVQSLRDWGRDCHCDPGVDNTCGNRFDKQYGNLPHGYDHKYTYSHLGYNLKITDMQAAVALAQMDRLEGFTKARKLNFNFLKEQLQDLQEYLILPEATPNSDPSWFGFTITLKPSVTQSRQELLKFLDKHKIGTRLLFAGNIINQPYFKEIPYRSHGSLDNTNIVMNRTFWLGVYPGLDEDMLRFVSDKLHEFFLG